MNRSHQTITSLQNDRIKDLVRLRNRRERDQQQRDAHRRAPGDPPRPGRRLPPASRCSSVPSSCERRRACSGRTAAGRCRDRVQLAPRSWTRSPTATSPKGCWWSLPRSTLDLADCLVRPAPAAAGRARERGEARQPGRGAAHRRRRRRRRGDRLRPGHRPVQPQRAAGLPRRLLLGADGGSRRGAELAGFPARARHRAPWPPAPWPTTSWDRGRPDRTGGRRPGRRARRAEPPGCWPSATSPWASPCWAAATP